MIRAFCLALACLAPASLPTQAQTDPARIAGGFSVEAPELYVMLDAMGVYDVLAILSLENARNAEAVEAAMFPGRGGPAWMARAQELFTPDRLTALFEAEFPQDDLTPTQIATITTFMESDTGRRLVAGEIAARTAFLDEGALDRGSEALLAAMEAEDERLETLLLFNDVNDLIDRNVSGALNARFAFFRGMVEGGAFEDDMPESTMVADVWAHEPEIRQTTVEWLFAFQFTAYSAASNADLQAYVALSQSEAGQALNSALFEAFDAVLSQLNYETGLAAAGYIASEDI